MNENFTILISEDMLMTGVRFKQFELSDTDINTDMFVEIKQ
jgi:hypothetical protein